MAKAGRANFSFSLEATSPTTPGCQPSDAVTMTAPLSSSPSEASASASACASAACSMIRRSELRRSSSAAIRAASETSPSSSSRTPRSARPMRPPALMRGAQHEAEMPGLGRTIEPRYVHQRGVPDMVAAAHCDQALGDERAIKPGQGCDVGNGAERDVVVACRADPAPAVRCSRNPCCAIRD